MRWFLPQAWSEEGSGGVYRLTYLGQSSIRPTTLRVEVLAPEGTTIYDASRDMQIDGDRAIWEGTPDARLELEVRFRPPLLARFWRAIF
jgi:hypothetical protein